jgi:F0F1-type ATP synthase assembly protein I
VAAWGKSREEREREDHETMAELEAAQAELRRPDGEGAVAYAARSFGESLLILLGAAAICVVGAVIGAVVAGTLGLVVGFLAGLVVCGVISVVAFGWGVNALRQRR